MVLSSERVRILCKGRKGGMATLGRDAFDGGSNAESKLLRELQLQGLMKECSYQEVMVLKATIPDFMWRRYKLAAYLDGPPHLKDKVMERDEELRNLLRGLGWTVLEFPYTPPLTDTRLREIIESIREALPK